jgi:hypothetical protein
MAVKTFTSEILTSSDTNTYLANSGLVYVTSATATSGTTISINNCFSATYDAYKIVATNLKTTGVASAQIRLRVSGTDSIVSYYFNGSYGVYTSATINGWNASNTTQFDTLIVADTSLSAGQMEVSNPFIAGFTSFSGQGNDPRTAGGGGNRFINGIHGVASSYDGFTWLAGGTITSATLTVYGYRKG